MAGSYYIDNSSKLYRDKVPSLTKITTWNDAEHFIGASRLGAILMMPWLNYYNEKLYCNRNKQTENKNRSI